MAKFFRKPKLLFGQKGFSLMEVMVAIFIVILALTATMVLLSRSFSGSTRSAAKLVAVNLSQEGIEIVRNMRDSNADWTSWLAPYSIGSTYSFSVQYDQPTLGGSYTSFLYFHSGSGLYDYVSAGGSATTFKREIILTKLSADELKVTSRVTWIERGATLPAIVAEDHFWNWR